MTTDTTVVATGIAGIVARSASVAGIVARSAFIVGIATRNAAALEQIAERNSRQARVVATDFVARSGLVRNIARIAGTVIARIAIGQATARCEEIPQPFAKFELRQARIIATDFVARSGLVRFIARIASNNAVARVALADADAFD